MDSDRDGRPWVDPRTLTQDVVGVVVAAVLLSVAGLCGHN